jgi:hypothetical protein
VSERSESPAVRAAATPPTTTSRSGPFASTTQDPEELWWDEQKRLAYNRAKRLFPGANEVELRPITMQFVV